MTTTSYAILGLLAIKPWTTYELAQQTGRAMRRFWPRARSKLYEEPKKLVAHGLARASRDHVGRRPRTTYTITAKGRRALATWLGKPGEGPVLEYEQLLQLFYAENASKEDILGILAAARQWSEQFSAEQAEALREYLAGGGQFRERLPQILLVGRFLDDFNRTLARWVEWATELVENWPEAIRDAEPDQETLERMVRDSVRS